MSRRIRHGQCGPKQSLYQPSYLTQGMSKMSISDTIPEGEGETMSSGMANFLGGNGSTPKRAVGKRTARGRHTNASSSITTTPRSGSTKPSSHITAESRSDERTPSRSKSATGNARNTINSSSNANTPKSSSAYAIHQQQLFRPRIALNGFNLFDEDSKAIEDALDGSFIDDSQPRSLRKMDVLVACPKTLQQSSVTSTTTAFLFALTTGKHIVTPEWIGDSIHGNKFLPPANYLLMDQEVAGEIDMSGGCKPHYSLSLAIANGVEAASNGGILAEFYFTLCPDIGDNKEHPFNEKEPSSEEVRMLLTAAGAIEVDVEDMDGTPHKLLVIMSMKATEKQIEYAKDLTQDGGFRVSLTVILQTLMMQSLDPLHKILEIRRKKAEEEKKTASTAAFFAPTKHADTEVVFKQPILSVTRSLSNPKVGDKNRAELGELGTLQVVCESDVRTVCYFDQAGILKFMSTAPSFKSTVPSLKDNNFVLFGNSGNQHCVAWEATNVAGKFSSTCDQEVRNRRFFFWFRDRPQLDTFLMALFGNGDPSRSILQEWYDKTGRFYKHEKTLPAHDMAAEEDEMDEYDYAKEAPSAPRAVGICEHGVDTYAESLRF